MGIKWSIAQQGHVLGIAVIPWPLSVIFVSESYFISKDKILVHFLPTKWLLCEVGSCQEMNELIYIYILDIGNKSAPSATDK